MTRNDIDLKKFQGKKRVFVKVAGTTGICRAYVWNEKRGQYAPPPRGHLYFARRWEPIEFGGKRRAGQYFASIDEARAWQSHCSPSNPDPGVPKGAADSAASEYPTFGEVYADWKQRHYPTLAPTTQVNYDRYWRLYLRKLETVSMPTLTSRVVDDWLAWLRATFAEVKTPTPRRAFLHELKALSVVVNHYREFWDDATFVNPLKRRHRQNVVVRRAVREASKDITRDEFVRFQAELAAMNPNGPMYAALATVQYFQALRISEVVALHWEDVTFDPTDPRNSRLTVRRHARYMRQKGREDHIAPGFKNSNARMPVKEQPLFPEAHEALRSVQPRGVAGLIFRSTKGTLLRYQVIQNAFNRAFARAGLPYTATHILRHGGTRKLYNATGDLSVAQQLLGNADYKTTLVYAQREKKALTSVAHEQWDRYDASKDAGSTWFKSGN